MAFEIKPDCITVEAGSDLSASQYCSVSINSSGQLALTGAHADPTGVLQNKPDAAGKAGTVAVAGVTKIVCGATVTKGGLVALDAAGKAVDAASNDIVIGEALETGASGRVISMLIKMRGRYNT